MILTKLERKNQNSFGKRTSYNIISMIILNNNYETIMSLCRKVQIVLQINSQSRKKLLKKISLRKSIFIVQTCFYFPHHRHHIEVTNSLLCRNTQYYGCTGYAMCGKRTCPTPQFRSGDTHSESGRDSLDRQSRALTAELQPATCGKLRC